MEENPKASSEKEKVGRWGMDVRMGDKGSEKRKSREAHKQFDA